MWRFTSLALTESKVLQKVPNLLTADYIVFSGEEELNRLRYLFYEIIFHIDSINLWCLTVSRSNLDAFQRNIKFDPLYCYYNKNIISFKLPNIVAPYIPNSTRFQLMLYGKSLSLLKFSLKVLVTACFR